MEKIVFSKGYEFELAPNGVIHSTNKQLVLTFLPGEYTAEELLDICSGNTEITYKQGDTAIQTNRNYILCNEVAIIRDYMIRTEYHCPVCDAVVDAGATTCSSCNAAFEGPNMVEIRGTVARVTVQIPNIDARMNDAENAIEDIIRSILGG